MSRAEALAELEELGVYGAQVYLLDVVPAIAMCWADGRAQVDEQEEIWEFMTAHVDRINQLAGFPVISHVEARAFVDRFLRVRPSPARLKRMIELLPAVSLSSSDSSWVRERQQAMLEACLDVAGAALSPKPRHAADFYSDEEKELYRELSGLLSPADGGISTVVRR
ncbi:MAG: hypothetical protein ACKVPX_11220 [Myxococcaceae bacterium]